MKKYQKIIKMLLLSIFLLSGCAHQNIDNASLPTINHENIDFNFLHDVSAKNDTISYSINNNKEIVLSLPEGAAIHTWYLSGETNGVKLLSQERMLIEGKKDTEGESLYRQEFVFEVGESTPRKIVMKKMNLEDLENTLEKDYEQVDPAFKLIIQINDE